jgi:tetratricopeptide (TPR) repeat protein
MELVTGVGFFSSRANTASRISVSASIWRLLLLVLLATSVSGCGYKDSFLVRKWNRPVQTPAYYQLAVPDSAPAAQGQNQTSAVGKIQDNAQAKSNKNKDAGAVDDAQTKRRKYLIEQHRVPSYTLRVLEEFEASAGSAISDPTKGDKAEKFLDHGMALTNLMCADFFFRLSQERQERNYRRDYFSNANTLFSTLLNLTKSSNLATGAVGALFGGIDADYQSVDRHYVAAADIPAAEALVRRALAEQARENSNLTSLTYSRAENRLIQYASTCSFNGIKSLINQSVLYGRVSVDESGAAVVESKSQQIGNYEKAKARQDQAFGDLMKCDWASARTAFEDANKIYPNFQVSYEYFKVLSSGLKDKKIGPAEELLKLANDSSVGRMPDDVKKKLQDDPNCSSTLKGN